MFTLDEPNRLSTPWSTAFPFDHAVTCAFSRGSYQLSRLDRGQKVVSAPRPTSNRNSGPLFPEAVAVDFFSKSELEMIRVVFAHLSSRANS